MFVLQSSFEYGSSLGRRSKAGTVVVLCVVCLQPSRCLLVRPERQAGWDRVPRAPCRPTRTASSRCHPGTSRCYMRLVFYGSLQQAPVTQESGVSCTRTFYCASLSTLAAKRKLGNKKILYVSFLPSIPFCVCICVWGTPCAYRAGTSMFAGPEPLLVTRSPIC